MDSEGGVDANVIMEGVYLVIRDAEELRSKRVKCNFTYDSDQVLRLE